MSKVDPIPPGFSALTPHIIVNDGAAAIEFYKKAFGAEEHCRMPGPDGKVMHAELGIGNARMMLAGEFPEQGCVSPKTLGGSPVVLHLYVADTDAAFKKAVDAGCTAAMPPMDMFWGDRYCKVIDPFGHGWSIATHTRDVTPEEMAKAMENMPMDCGN